MITENFLHALGFVEFERDSPEWHDFFKPVWHDFLKKKKHRGKARTFELWHEKVLFAIYLSPKGMLGEAIGPLGREPLEHYYIEISEPEHVLELLTFRKSFEMKWGLRE